MFLVAIQPEMRPRTPPCTTRCTSTHGNSRTVRDRRGDDCRFVCGPDAANPLAIS
jgi:hypothetical protein